MYRVVRVVLNTFFGFMISVVMIVVIVGIGVFVSVGIQNIGWYDFLSTVFLVVMALIFTGLLLVVFYETGRDSGIADRILSRFSRKPKR